MTNLERLGEALIEWDTNPYGTDLAPIVEAARAYRDLLANGPDYEAAEALFADGADLDWLNDGRLAVDVLVHKIVDVALIPSTEEEA